jgi:hypothetical protein
MRAATATNVSPLIVMAKTGGFTAVISCRFRSAPRAYSVPDIRTARAIASSLMSSETGYVYNDESPNAIETYYGEAN